MAYDLIAATVRGPLAIVTTFGFFAVATTAFRFASRRLTKKRIGTNDYLIALSLVFVLFNLGLLIACITRGGTGRHASEIDSSEVVLTLKLILPFEAFYGISLMLVKLGILSFYVQIFGAQRPSFCLCTYIIMALNVLATMSILFEMAFLCHPLAYNWDPSTPGGGCGNRNASSVSSDMVNLFTDIMVIALPLPTIWHLHLPLRPKLGLMLVFSLGMFISIISILRLQSLYAISFTDPTFTLPMVLMWSVLEAELLVIAANLPTLRPILARLFPSVFGTPRATEAISGRSRRARPLTGRARMQFDTSILSRLESGTATNESASNGSRLSNGAGEKALPVVVLPLGCNPEHWRDEDRIAGC